MVLMTAIVGYSNNSYKVPLDALKEQIGHSGGSEILIGLLESKVLELQQKAAILLRSISVNGIYPPLVLVYRFDHLQRKIEKNLPMMVPSHYLLKHWGQPRILL